ncbi:hypothetical protein ACF9IK_03120 [Kitasatospora hibisci]
MSQPSVLFANTGIVKADPHRDFRVEKHVAGRRRVQAVIAGPHR